MINDPQMYLCVNDSSFQGSALDSLPFSFLFCLFVFLFISAAFFLFNCHFPPFNLPLTPFNYAC